MAKDSDGHDTANGDLSPAVSTPPPPPPPVSNQALASSASSSSSSSVAREKHPSAGTNSNSNMVVLNASEGFPQPTAHYDDGDGAETRPTPPFVLVAGEGVRFVGRTRDRSAIFLTNYRFYVAASSHGSPLVNVALGAVESVELKELFHLHLACRDCRSYKISLADNASAESWHARVRQAVATPTRKEDVFAFAHMAWAGEEGVEELAPDPTDEANRPIPGFDDEVSRLRFDLEGAWRISDANKDFRLCATYPERIVVPAGVTDAQLEQIASFRSARRVPSVVWRHVGTGAVLVRCSQPEVGILGWRCDDDEKLFSAIANSSHYDRSHCGGSNGVHNGFGGGNCSSVSASEDGGSVTGGDENGSLGGFSADDSSSVNGSINSDVVDGDRVGSNGENGGTAAIPCNGRPASNGGTDSSADRPGLPSSYKDLTAEAKKTVGGKGSVRKVLIMDARSYTAAFGNRARGGGVECIEYYHDCDVVFMSLPNIHTIRKAFFGLRNALLAASVDQAAWYSGLENTKWLLYISGLLNAAVQCARALEEEGRPVVVHCSDGWDRTPQITSLAQLLLDPYYRTVEGFEVLVEREWLSYGHKMADRNGSAFACADTNERCPIFLQWLDCVHQLLLQFPTAFQFNFAYLIKLARHVNSNLFGNFLCNSRKERREVGVGTGTRCLWRYLRFHPGKFCNHLYDSGKRKLDWPKTDVKILNVWLDVYGNFPKTGAFVDGVPAESAATGNGVAAEAAESNGHSSSDSNGRTPPIAATSYSSSSAMMNGLSGIPDVGMVGAGALANGWNALAAALSDHGRTSSSSQTNTPPSSRQDGQEEGGLVIEQKSEKVAEDEEEVEAAEEAVERSREEQQPKDASSSNGEQQPSSSSSTSSSSAQTPAAPPVSSRAAFVSSTDTLVGEENGVSIAGGAVPKRKAVLSRSLSSGNQAALGGILPDDDAEAAAACRSAGGMTGGQGSSANPTGGGSCPMDSDGLLSHHDPVQERVKEMVERHRSEVIGLRKQVYAAKQRSAAQAAANGVLLNGAGGGADGGARRHRLPSENGGAAGGLFDRDDPGSLLGQPGSTTSETPSWENVEEKDAQPTRWLPDHATTSCMKCGTNFWMGLRKHHCRSCGGIFCSACSNQFKPVPNEQLYDPVRVCDDCVEKNAVGNDGNGVGGGVDDVLDALQQVD